MTHKMTAMKHVVTPKLAITVGNKEGVDKPLPTTMKAFIMLRVAEFFFLWKSKTLQETMTSLAMCHTCNKTENYAKA